MSVATKINITAATTRTHFNSLSGSVAGCLNLTGVTVACEGVGATCLRCVALICTKLFTTKKKTNTSTYDGRTSGSDCYRVCQ